MTRVRPILNCKTRKSAIVRGQKCFFDSDKPDFPNVSFDVCADIFEADNGSDHRTGTIILQAEKSTRKPGFACITLLSRAYSNLGIICGPIVFRHVAALSMYVESMMVTIIKLKNSSDTFTNKSVDDTSPSFTFC